MNKIKDDEIKNSVEYKWRSYQVKVYLVVLMIILVVTFIVPLLSLILKTNSFKLALLIWLCFNIIIGLILGGFALYNFYKNKYLLNNYKKFKYFEVTLDNVCVSYMYKGTVYYNVTIIDEDKKIDVKTNPYFSSFKTAQFTLEDYNNKKVCGLYDDKLNKFYIISKID